MNRTLTGLSCLFMAMSACACANPQFCPPEEYCDFEPDPVQGCQLVPGDMTVWLVAGSLDGVSCLPRDLTIRNVAAPQGCDVTVLPPGWIKGRPLMAIYIRGDTSLLTGQAVSLDIYQGALKRQTVTISIASTPDASVIVNGERLNSGAAQGTDSGNSGDRN